MAETLRPKDHRFILVCLLICAASLFIGIRYFHRAFPEASINFKYNRDSSLPLATEFLKSRGLETGGYMHAAAFRYDDETKVFLERSLGLERANALMGKEIRLWRWGHRWFRPLNKEEIRVEITPEGHVASFFHALPEEAAGANPPEIRARGLAESFLARDMKRPIEFLEYLESQAQKRPNRTDYVFTWKIAGLDLRGANYRISVTLHGDRVDGYDEFLRIPEEWSRGYARLRSLNESTAQVDVLFFVLLGLAMLVTLGRHIRARDIRWKTALLFGAISFILQFLASLNEFPLTKFDFPTTSSYASFLSQSLVLAFLGALSLGGIIFLLTACAEPLFRQSFPASLSISKFFSWQAVRSRKFFIAALAGVTLTFFFFAYEIGFYLIANRFGAWAPAEIPYSDLLNTHFPWIFVLLGGFFPAVSEEWMFRAFSIPFLNKLLRSRWIAVILASFIWGFGHANYPNQPFFIRGIEVGIVGLIMSWAMFRFGILAPLIAHYSIDAFYSAFLLLRSGNAYLVASGAVTAGINLVPLLMAAGAYLFTREFRSDSTVTNEGEGAQLPVAWETVASQPAVVSEYRPLPSSRRWAAIILLVAGTALVFLRAPRFGNSIRLKISASQAEQSARSFLAGRQFELQGYQSVAQIQSRVDSLAAQYLYSAAGIRGLNRIFGDRIKPAVWEIRFYRPLQKEEFSVDVAPDTGNVVSYRHLLAEEATGADIREEKAQDIAASFLKSIGYNLSQYQLKETKSEKPKQRRDTEFIWEALPGTPGVIANARLRIQAIVLGDNMGSWTEYVKLPESWVRERERQGLFNIVALVLRTLLPVIFATLGAFTLIRGIRLGLVQWKLAARTAVVVMAVELAHVLNNIPALLFHYDTQLSMKTYLVAVLVEVSVGLIGIGLAAGLTAALLTACYPNAVALLRRHCRAFWARDAAFSAAAALGGFLILQWITGQVYYHASSMALAPSIATPDSLDGYVPLLSEIRYLVLTVLFLGAILMYGTYLWAQWKSHPWRRGLMIAGMAGTLLPASAMRWSEILADMAPSALLIGFAFLLISLFLRDNYAAYILSILALADTRRAASLLGQGNRWLEVQGWILWALLLGLTAYIITRPRSSEDQGS